MTISILRGVSFNTNNINEVDVNTTSNPGVFPDGAIIVDMSSNTLRLGDGATQGGVAVAGGGGGGVSNIVDDTTPELGGNLVTGDNRITYAGSGTVSFLDFTVTQFGQNNNTVLSSVKSINMFLDSNGGDSAEAFRIYNNTNPDSTPTEDTYIFKVSENGDTNITGKLLLPDGSVSANYAGFGANDDLKIFHNGNHSIVRETGTGNLYLQSNDNVILSKDSDTEIMVKAIADGAVELYHNSDKKFETTATGVEVTGTVSGTNLTSAGLPGVIKAFAHVDVSPPITASADYNVASVVSNSTGKYDVTFTNALPNANYVVSLSVQTNVSSNHYTLCYYNRTTTGFQVQKFLNGALDSGASGNFSFVIYQA